MDALCYTCIHAMPEVERAMAHDTPNTTIWGNVFQITISTTPSCSSFPLVLVLLLLLLHKSLSALNMHQGLADVVGALLCMVTIFVFTFIFHTFFLSKDCCPKSSTATICQRAYGRMLLHKAPHTMAALQNRSLSIGQHCRPRTRLPHSLHPSATP
jgi:hypothetical protein